MYQNRVPHLLGTDETLTTKVAEEGGNLFGHRPVGVGHHEKEGNMSLASNLFPIT